MTVLPPPVSQDVPGNGSENPPSPIQKTAAFLGRLMIALGLLSAGFSILSWLHPWWWGFEAMAELRYASFQLLIPAILAALLMKKWIPAGICLLAWLPLVSILLPYFAAVPPAALGPDRLRICTMNVHTANRNFAGVLDYIRAQDPDIAFFMEVDDLWLEQLNALAGSWPITIARPRADNFGVAMFSRVASTTMEFLDILTEVPSIVAKVPLASGVLTVVGTHPLPPRRADYTAARNFQLTRLAQLIASWTGPTMVVGDLNATPWAPAFQQFLRETGLRDSSFGRGITPTWPVMMPWGRIPIDHALVSRELIVGERKVGGRVGSDHYPLFLEVGLATARP